MSNASEYINLYNAELVYLHVQLYILSSYGLVAIDNFPYRQIFVLDKSRPKKLHSRKEPFKSSKIPKFG